MSRNEPAMKQGDVRCRVELEATAWPLRRGGQSDGIVAQRSCRWHVRRLLRAGIGSEQEGRRVAGGQRTDRGSRNYRRPCGAVQPARRVTLTVKGNESISCAARTGGYALR